MKIESFKKDNNIIKQELIKESKKTDPTKSSLLPSGLTLEKVEDSKDKDWNKYKKNIDKLFTDREVNKYKDKETGEIFYNKQTSSIPYEHFVTLFSKGILHVSDIVEKDDKVLSRKIKLNKVEEKSSKEEIEAEFFMLGYLFEDWDKDSVLLHNYFRKNGKFAHLDYGEAFHARSEFGYKGDIHELGYKTSSAEGVSEKVIGQVINSFTGGNWRKDVKKFFKDFPLRASGHFLFLNKKKFLNQILMKAKEFSKRLDDNIFFNRILEKSKVDLFSDRFSFLKKEDPIERENEFRDIMKNRLFVLEKVIDDMSNKNYGNN